MTHKYQYLMEFSQSEPRPAHLLKVAAVTDGDVGRGAAAGVLCVLDHGVGALVRVHVAVEQDVDAVLVEQRLVAARQQQHLHQG